MDLTREERDKLIEIILNNQDKTLNEIKGIIKREMSIEERTKFTGEQLFQLITELNKMEHNTHGEIKSTKKIEGEER